LKKNTLVLLAALILLPTVILGQSSNEIVSHLDNSLSFEHTVLTNGAMSQISNIEIVKVRMILIIDKDEYGSGGPVFEKYYSRIGDKLKKISSPLELIELPEFINNFKSNFKLKTPEDGLVLQTALSVITEDERNEGFFVHDNKWYFIRSEFWRSYFVVKTDNNGNITSIKHTKGIEEDIPDDVHYYSETEYYPEFETPELSESVINQLTQLFKEEINYRFTVEEGQSEYFNKISAAKYHRANFIVSEQYEDETYESSHQINVISYKGEIESSSKIWETKLFLESMKPVFSLKTDSDALLFQSFLNEQEYKDHDVRFYREDELWMFVRDESFGEEEGYIVKADDNGTVTRIGNRTGFSEPDILRFRMQEPGFEVDYGFKLKYPEENSFRLVKDELDYALYEGGDWIEIDVSIEFNEQAVNASGAWILTRFKGENAGIYASTSMTSPYTDSIPVLQLQLEKGNYEVEYFLLKAGQEETENYLGRVVVEIVVE